MARRRLLHGHCHQKAFDAMGAVEKVLRLVPELKVEPSNRAAAAWPAASATRPRTTTVSMKMAEAALLPAVRAAGGRTVIVADGTSCRHQIADGAQREAVHVAVLLARQLR
jgi:Fe-S oxidoreductase